MTDPVPHAARCDAHRVHYRGPSCPLCGPKARPEESCRCGDALAMDHSFDRNMNCYTCNLSYEEHQAAPAPCAMAHVFNKIERCRRCGISRKQHNRSPAKCRGREA